MADDAVLDAPVLDDAVQTDVQDSVADDAVQQDDAQTDPAAVPDAQQEAEGDGRTLPQWIRNLKSTDPAAYKEAKGVFFGKKSLDDELKDFDLKGVKGWLEEVGGKDAIAQQLTELTGKASELDGINQAIQSGDPELIKEIAEAHPESFSRLAQATFQEWAQRDQEGWQHAMSGVMAQTIAQSGIPMFLERMQMLLEFGKTEEVQKAITDLKTWSGSFAQTAAKPIQQQAPKQYDQKLQELTQRESQMFQQDFSRRVEEIRTPLIAKELEPFVSRAPNDADKKELAIATIRSRVDKAVEADAKLQGDVRAFLAKRDLDGAARLIKSREAALIATIAPAVGRTIFGAPPAPKPVAPPARTPQRTQASTPQRRDKFAEIFDNA